ncbi:MAG: tyrosine-type recombinase/integrase [Gallionella sp.]|nr:tyrosine-type recombinase/integrase [Gallionella sp.]
MELVYSTEDFLLRGQPYPGFPILLHDTMESCTHANSFMRHYLLRGAIGSKRSWPSTGRAMYDYFSFLQVHELNWDDVQRGEEHSLVAAYRDYCLDTIGLARNTVSQRLLYVCELYKYALKEGWVDALPFGYEARNISRNGYLAHVDASGGKTMVRDVNPKKHRALPKFLSKDEIKALITAANNPHHRLLIRFALQTGLRREEIATFPLAYVMAANLAVNGEANIRIRLAPRDGHGIRTKGSKPRDIYISRRLMRDLHHYAVHTRGQRASLSEVKHPQLFLNQRGEKFSEDGKRIERIVRDAGARVGIQVHPHMLRHTYATHTLCAMQRSNSGIDPLVFVQRQLGHSSIQTTMVYLHLVNERADEAVLAYDDELNDWMDA